LGRRGGQVDVRGGAHGADRQQQREGGHERTEETGHGWSFQMVSLGCAELVSVPATAVTVTLVTPLVFLSVLIVALALFSETSAPPCALILAALAARVAD